MSPEMQQVLSTACWFLLVTFLQLSLYPALKKTFDRYAFPAAFAGSLLIFTLVTWYCGICRIPIQLALIPFIALFLYHTATRCYTVDDMKKQWQWELVFCIFFFLMLEARYLNPTISYAEKFMDHAFLASIMRYPVVPPLDPWFAGGVIDGYYYLGYWLVGCLGITSSVPSNIAFNLALPTVLGVSAVTLYAIGDLLIGKLRYLLLVTLLLPNPSFFWQLAIGKGIHSVIWDSTRTITDTITEYPLFSFVWGDVHPHVVAIFNQLLLIFLLLFAYLKWRECSGTARLIVCLLAALSLGTMPAMNTWDVLIYAPVVVLFGILIWWQNRSRMPGLHAAGLLLSVPPLAIASYLPFYFRLKASTGGPAIVTMPTEPAQFFLVSGFFIAGTCLLLYRDIAKRPYLVLVAVPFVLLGYPAAALAAVPVTYLLARGQHEPAHILGIIGFLLIILTEFLYLKDNMGDTYFRMNTVFKCYNVAWLLLSISLFTLAGQMLTASGRMPELSGSRKTAAVVAVVTLLAAVPLIVPLDMNYGSRSLDGLAYLATSHTGDAAAVAYLRALPADPSFYLVEAEGGDYTYFSRISAFTGIPAILGEPFHEFMWRGDRTGWYSGRINDIRAIYEKPDESVGLLQKYNATYLIVGDPEREKYNVSLPASGLEKVFSHDGTDIYRVNV